MINFLFLCFQINFYVFKLSPSAIILKYLIHGRLHLLLFHSTYFNYYLKMSNFGLWYLANKHTMPTICSNHIPNLIHRTIMKEYFDIFSTNLSILIWNLYQQIYQSIFYWYRLMWNYKKKMIHKKKSEIIHV